MKARIALSLIALLGISSAGCGRPAHTSPRSQDEAILFQGMGRHHRRVTTDSPQAQRYFDQGLTWTYAFNHDEAIRSFRRATQLDPDCAMAWWGIALASGPHINNPVVPLERSNAAGDALQKALALEERCSEVERDLIHAQARRFAHPPPEDRRPLDEAYAAAMREVWSKHPNDADVGTLFAESLMDLRPWDLWAEDGKPQPGTEEILAVLEATMRLYASHPGANHLYIHAVEASGDPQRGKGAADRLRDLVPASGHLVHMPSHIDVVTGEWELAARQNEKAIRADNAYRHRRPRQGFYHVYMLHNHHMLAFASMMEGRSGAAICAAREVVASVPDDYGRQNAAMVDPYMGAIYDALKRFGRWDEILREPPPPAYWPITTAHWRFARGVALAAKGNIEQARQEQQAFLEAIKQVPEGATMAINPAHRILEISTHMLEGEIAFQEKKTDEAIAALRKAIAAEDQLRYMEPPEWIQPVRHTLGAVLLSAGRHEEAEQVYREDLKKWPNNGWSLHGLGRALHMRGEEATARSTDEQFQRAWGRADVRIASSCACVAAVADLESN